MLKHKRINNVRARSVYLIAIYSNKKPRQAASKALRLVLTSLNFKVINDVVIVLAYDFCGALLNNNLIAVSPMLELFFS